MVIAVIIIANTYIETVMPASVLNWVIKSFNPCKKPIIIPILQMNKLSLREFKEAVQGHTARKWRSQDSSQCGQIS